MAKPLIAGNWKMHLNSKEAVAMIKKLKPLIKGNKADILLCPSFTLLSTLSKELKGTKISLGAQNMHSEEQGAFTGEISPLMLKDVHCSYVIIGHSERRNVFGETNGTINKKMISSLQHNLKPILCIGETLAERESGTTNDILKDQLTIGLKGISNISSVTIAYEPVWAIGTGRTATPQQAQEAHSFIRSLLSKKYGSKAKSIRILYGGSVKPGNAADILSQDDIKRLVKESDQYKNWWIIKYRWVFYIIGIMSVAFIVGFFSAPVGAFGFVILIATWAYRGHVMGEWLKKMDEKMKKKGMIPNE